MEMKLIASKFGLIGNKIKLYMLDKLIEAIKNNLFKFFFMISKQFFFGLKIAEQIISLIMISLIKSLF